MYIFRPLCTNMARQCCTADINAHTNFHTTQSDEFLHYDSNLLENHKKCLLSRHLSLWRIIKHSNALPTEALASVLPNNLMSSVFPTTTKTGIEINKIKFLSQINFCQNDADIDYTSLFLLARWKLQLKFDLLSMTTTSVKTLSSTRVKCPLWICTQRLV